MRDRLLLGPVLIALLIGGLALDQWLPTRGLPDALQRAGFERVPPGAVIFVVMALLNVLASRELGAILAANGVQGSKRIMMASASAGLLVSCLVPRSADPIDAIAAVGTAAAGVVVVALAFYSRHKSVEGVVAATGGAVLSFVYLGVMFGFLLAIRRDHPAWVLLWVLLVTKSCDIGAYFTGKAIGRHKLIPWLSPGKTWEGLAGGVIFSGLVSWAGLWVLHRTLGTTLPSAWVGVLPGVLFGFVGQAGDLLESVLKRDAGMKDSGAWLPGFGGVLDVLDSPLLVAPVAFWLLRAFERAGISLQSP